MLLVIRHNNGGHTEHRQGQNGFVGDNTNKGEGRIMVNEDPLIWPTRMLLVIRHNNGGRTQNLQVQKI